MSQVKLSHSSMSKFQMCGKSYEFHYIKRIRPNFTTGALLFGSALDAALNVVLLNENKSPEAEFESKFSYAKINDSEEFIPTNEKVLYSNSDFDADILTQDDYKVVADYIEKGVINKYTNYLEVYKVLGFKKRSGGIDSLETKEKCFYNLMNWLSLKRKGFLMIDAYKRKVMPRIKKVIAVQESVDLTNEVGDSITGFVDLIAEFDDHGPVILDNKTSTMEYELDSVVTSQQLSLYTHILENKYNTRKAGYIVMRKQVVKNRKKVCSKCGYNGTGGRHKTCDNVVNNNRCNGEWTETLDPDIDIQVIIDTIPDIAEAIVLENADVINESIKMEKFTRNLNSCKNWYGGNCCYIDLCYKNKKDGLIDLTKPES